MTVVTLTLALVLTMTHPASGQTLELIALDLRGPGMTGSVTLSRAELGPFRGQRSPAAVALAQLAREHPLRPPSDGLGPRYELTYHVDIGLSTGIRAVTVAVQLYPYAEGGPLAYTPPGQETRDGPGSRWGGYRLPAGWYRYPPALVRMMQRQGLPSRAAALGASGQGTTTNRLLLIAIVLAFVFLSRGLRRKSAVLPRRPPSV
ncbi:MAG: hypothetical protein M3333_06605 [Actinomycetota bacterium]|nr:hypothetical protein [Actinomycetota bacterium]